VADGSFSLKLQFLNYVTTGCGIGVLLRMFFVLTIVAYRAFKGQREEEHEYSHIVTLEQYEDATPLPAYSYPVDEKVKIATVEESK